jgi:hypothetical protein
VNALRSKLIAAISGSAAVLAPLSVAPCASAEPVNDPCQIASSIFCRFVPVAPELDGDVDLTTQLPQADLTVQAPDTLPPAYACIGGCV